MNNREFFNQLLERSVRGVCLWENFESESRCRLYKLTGGMYHKGDALNLRARYLDNGETVLKTMGEMSHDYIATPRDLIEFGKSSSQRQH